MMKPPSIFFLPFLSKMKAQSSALLCIASLCALVSADPLSADDYSGTGTDRDPCCHRLAYLYPFGPLQSDTALGACDGKFVAQESALCCGSICATPTSYASFVKIVPSSLHSRLQKNFVSLTRTTRQVCDSRSTNEVVVLLFTFPLLFCVSFPQQQRAAII